MNRTLAKQIGRVAVQARARSSVANVAGLVLPAGVTHGVRGLQAVTLGLGGFLILNPPRIVPRTSFSKRIQGTTRGLDHPRGVSWRGQGAELWMEEEGTSSSWAASSAPRE